MWKILCFLLLIIIFDNCSTLESLRLRKGIETTRAIRNDNDQKSQLDIDEPEYEDDYNSPEDSHEYRGGRLIGRWRNNGEAIEPKWRDGDSIPLVPFEEAATGRKATPKLKEKWPNDGHDVINKASSTNKYRETSDEHNKKTTVNTQTSNIKSMPQFVSPSKEIRNYGSRESYEGSRHSKYANIPRNGSRRYLTRIQKPLELPPAEIARPAIVYTNKSVHQAVLRDDDKKILENDDIKMHFDATNYQNPLRIHIDDYELNDEEYHRPRSRKRKPPQNYEYVETKTPYPSLDFWKTSSEASSTVQINNSRLDDNPLNENRKNFENSQLKSLLKMQQIEGLSLSEILQQRNLTLGDLLNRKMEIINALKATNDAEIQYDTSTGKINLQKQPIIKQRITSEGPNWMTNRQVRIKELRRNFVQTTTPINRYTWREISNNTNMKSNETENALRIIDDKRKSHNNEKLSIITNNTELTDSPRLNSTRAGPIAITTTSKSTINDIIMQYDSERHLTTVQSVDKEEIMEFSDFAEKKHHDESSFSSSELPIIVITPESTVINNEYSLVEEKNNDVDKDPGSTLSIEHILLTELTTNSTLTPTFIDRDHDNKSNTLDYNGSGNDANSYDLDELEYQNDGPTSDEEKKSADELLVEMFGNLSESTKLRKNDSTIRVTKFDELLPANHRPLSSHTKIYDQVISEVEPEARAEILELISTGASAQNLEQLLKSRNMSIDELIALRQRGSSRVHLADISPVRPIPRKNKPRGDQSFTSFQTPKINRSKSDTTTPIITTSVTSTTAVSTHLQENEDLSELSIYSTLGNINDHMDKINETERLYVVVDKTPIIIKISSRTGKDEKGDRITTQADSAELVNLLSAFDSLPFAIYNNYPSNVESTTLIKNKETTKSHIMKFDLDDTTNRIDITTDSLETGLVEEMVQDTIDEGTSRTDENYMFIPRYEDDRKTLSKIRPSIIASGAILGMTIVGFLAIFIVCRIRQKQKYMYKNTFSKAVFQPPVMNVRKLSNSSSLNTIMVNVVATSTAKRSMNHETRVIEDNFEIKSDIDNDSLDANDSWDTIPDFMK